MLFIFSQQNKVFFHKIGWLVDLHWAVFNDFGVMEKLSSAAFQRHQNCQERANISRPNDQFHEKEFFYFAD